MIFPSGSGNSKNAIRAVEYAKEIGIPVIGITGYHGGRLKEMADCHMRVMVDDMQISEDIHMIFDHLMYYVLIHIMINSSKEHERNLL